MIAFALFTGAALLAAALLARLIPHLHAARVLDVPNARSLHGAPVPRGGGLAIAAVTLLVELVLVLSGDLPRVAGLVVMVVGAGFAALGWADDRVSRGVASRLAAQALLAALFVIGALPDASLTLRCLWWLALLWHVNLFNFMDGADGLAGVQTLCAGLACAALLASVGAHGAAWVALALAGAALGFLRCNWHPARVFLGDAGSYFIGFQLGALAAWSAPADGWPWRALLLFAPFVVDASLTLLARAARGEAVWRAHRDHAYQRLVTRRGWSPARLAIGLALINVLLCWPAAALGGAWPVTASVFVYGLLAIIWAWARR
ncbi:MAG: glycosyl transferase, partial [Gammaproteobacteria bacterium]